MPNDANRKAYLGPGSYPRVTVSPPRRPGRLAIRVTEPGPPDRRQQGTGTVALWLPHWQPRLLAARLQPGPWLSELPVRPRHRAVNPLNPSVIMWAWPAAAGPCQWAVRVAAGPGDSEPE